MGQILTAIPGWFGYGPKRITYNPLECQVCQRPFGQSDKAPVALSCGHSSCRECLRSLARKGGSLQCPVCSATHSGQPLGELRDNFDLLNAGTKSEAAVRPTLRKRKNVSRAPECRVCRQNYSKGALAPVALSCGHSACRTCLRTILEMKSTLKCPTCAVVHSGPSLDELRDNAGLLEAVARLGALQEEEVSRQEEPAAETNSIRILVKDLTDKQFPITIDPSRKFQDAKEMLSSQYGLTRENIRLLYKGKRLEDSKTPNDYNITHGSVVQMAMAYLGGANRSIQVEFKSQWFLPFFFFFFLSHVPL
ncbi:uncharacterized protein LOC125034166 [Penaeus chinensis]|uniref:uncharacterized protein LOC125034166 n=1 Tax=Penaeus chinensis TaxID=139456 RepID=UPI001FB7788A|nr:uncharacterized protein LOC125034166 [Penaeus chinensis]